ncbi:hypothetical protein BOTBODRAFT_623768 [Botryobasidium botryosum FD-172 SS1]|uniref:Methyltransferase domain-containing protein n=1 Tax=Botryobasidium botryosum (strain FD-172 SS1) TaxID=930990 RepID=A0A067MJT2_BOTB1|nr:hypothetical protein BOTBODRAFT_623768 [Botryobasidium botryosum FD-172 SS1]
MASDSALERLSWCFGASPLYLLLSSLVITKKSWLPYTKSSPRTNNMSTTTTSPMQATSDDTRTYHSFPGAHYILPADEIEKERLDRQHRLLKRAYDDKLIWVPVDLVPGSAVLDAGAGSGAWLLDLADQVPGGVQLYGIDIESRLFPPPQPNIEFINGSVTALPSEWSSAFQLIEESGAGPLNLESGPVTTRFHDMIFKLNASREHIYDCALHIPKFLADAGFVNVRAEVRGIPLGKWAGKEGCENRDNIVDICRGIKTPVLKARGFGYVSTGDEFDRFLAEVAEEWDNTPGSKWNFTIFSAQKPVSEDA